MFEGIKKLLGDENAGALKKASRIVSIVNAFEEEYTHLSDSDFPKKTAEFKARIGKGETLEDIMPEAFAAVREASKRTLGQRHYDVQIVGGAVLHNGDIAEMRTGEGKTLVATLPVYLNALTGKGVHVITVNDYLSRRDAVWMGQIYAFLGMSVGIINHETSYLYDENSISNDGTLEKADKERDEKGAFDVIEDFLKVSTRKEAYAADITYGTNNEFGFDYLRDNISYKKEELRQRTPAEGGYNFAIVDEIDSILIDEARTPLIISAPAADAEKLYGQFAHIAQTMTRETDYTVDEKLKAIQLTDIGIEKAEKILGVDNIYTDRGIKYVHHLETAVRAKALFERDKDYVVHEGEVIIVDEFTGRMQPGRRWSEGLHQAMEAKENVEVQQESRTFASITYQNYFRNYDKLAGMTGTAVTSSEEFYKVYGLNTVAVPTNKDVRRIDHDDFIFQTERGKFQAIARKVREINEKGQPILIGTASVEKNELLGAYLTKEGIKHEILNAKNHEREGSIVADAGRKGAVTVATNMAGRGVDIKLGGEVATPEQQKEIRELGGLFVLGTERHEARRIDNQLRGRSGRQGDPGETQFFVSLEDTLMRVFANDTIKGMMGRFGIPEDEPIQNKIITRSLETAQKKIEGFHFDSRKQVLAYDDVLNLQRTSLYGRRNKILLGESAAIDTELTSLIGDDEKELKIIADKKSQIGEEAFYVALQRVFLQTLDMLWVDHLETMDYLRSSVNLRAYGQRDPLLEYKKEGLRLFSDLEFSYKEHVLRLLPQLSGEMFVRPENQQMKEVHENASILGKKDGDQKAHAAKRTEINSIGRNEPCPCGSGQKYKKCGLINSEEHQKCTQKRI